MLRRPHFFFYLIIACVAAPDVHAGLFSITNPQFSAYVDPVDYQVSHPAQNGKISRKQLTDNLLYFSVTIVGFDAALKYLEEHQHLELRVDIWPGWKKEDSVQIGISPKDWARDKADLRAEFKRKGFFTWRTFMNTVKVWNPKIELRLFDDNAELVGPADHPGGYKATIIIID